MDGRPHDRSFLDSFGDFRSARHRPSSEKCLIDAVDDGNTRAVASILKTGTSPNILIGDDCRSFLLHSAVNRMFLDIVSELLSCGADVNCRNRYGETPLLLACRLRSFAMVSLLLRYRASTTTPDTRGRTPSDFIAYRPMGQVMERCLAAKDRCPHIPLFSDFMGIVVRRGGSLPAPANLNVDMNSKLDLEMLFMCYLSVMSLGGYYEVCQQDLWGRVHYDVTGKVDDRPSDFNELDLYRHYLIHVEDDLIASCPPSPEYYAGHSRSHRDYSPRHRHESYPRRRAYSREPPYAHHSPQVPRRPPVDLANRPKATHGEPSNNDHIRRELASFRVNAFRDRRSGIHMHSDRDPRLARESRSPEKRHHSSKPTKHKPEAAPGRGSHDDVCWSTTSRGLQSLKKPRQEQRRPSEESLSSKRLLFGTFKKFDMKETPGHHVPPLMSKVLSSLDSSTPKSTTSASPVVLSGSHNSKRDSNSLQPASVSTAATAAAALDSNAHGPCPPLQRSATGLARRAEAKLAADSRPSRSHVLSGSKIPGRRDLSVLARLTASLSSEPSTRAPADSTTSDMPTVSLSNTKILSPMPTEPKRDIIDLCADGDAQGSVCEDTPSSVSGSSSTASFPGLVIATDLQSQTCNASMSPASSLYTAEEDTENEDIVSKSNLLTTMSREDRENYDEISLMSGASSPYHSPSPSRSDGNSDCDDGQADRDNDDFDRSSTGKKNSRMIREVNDLTLSAKSLSSPSQEVSLPDFITDPSLLTREQRKLQQTLQQFQVMEMRASAKAIRQRKKPLAKKPPPPKQHFKKRLGDLRKLVNVRSSDSEESGSPVKTGYRKVAQEVNRVSLHEHLSDSEAGRARLRRRHFLYMSAAKIKSREKVERRIREPVAKEQAAEKKSGRYTRVPAATMTAREKRNHRTDVPTAHMKTRASVKRCMEVSAANVKARAKINRARIVTLSSRYKLRKLAYSSDVDQGGAKDDNESRSKDRSDSPNRGPKKFQDFQPVILPTRFRAATAALAGTVSCDEEPGSRLNRPAPKPVMQVLPRVQEPVAKSGVNTSTGPAPCPTDTSQLPPEVSTVKRKKKVVESKPKDSRGETALHRAARSHDLRRLERHIEDGMDVNCRDNAGWSPLHEAINKNFLDAAEILLQHGASPDHMATDGTTPLDDALESDSLEAVQLLFRFGANPSCAQNAANLKVPEDTDCAKLFLEMLSSFKETATRRELPSSCNRNKFGSRPSAQELEIMEPGLRKDIVALQRHLTISEAKKPQFYAGAAFEVSEAPFLPTYSLAGVPCSPMRQNYVLLEDVLEVLDYEMPKFVADFSNIHVLRITMGSFRRIYTGSLYNPEEPLDRITGYRREDDEEICLLLWNEALRTVMGIDVVVL